jgi:tetratricopeptide (TPR) repeat protein/ADP-heptose:LPS heptosyltransferase/glycosyltransferase involved in cell wall biosynthesis
MFGSDLASVVIHCSMGEWEAAAAAVRQSGYFANSKCIAGLLLLDLDTRCGCIDGIDEHVAVSMRFAAASSYVTQRLMRIETIRSVRAAASRSFEPAILNKIDASEVSAAAREAMVLQHWGPAVELWRRCKNDAIMPIYGSPELCRALWSLGRHQEVLILASDAAADLLDPKSQNLVESSRRYQSRATDKLSTHVKRFIKQPFFELLQESLNGNASQAAGIGELVAEFKDLTDSLKRLGKTAGVERLTADKAASRPDREWGGDDQILMAEADGLAKRGEFRLDATARLATAAGQWPDSPVSVVELSRVLDGEARGGSARNSHDNFQAASAPSKSVDRDLAQREHQPAEASAGAPHARRASTGPATVEDLLALAVRSSNVGQYRSALRSLEEAVARAPQHFGCLWLLGKTQLALGRADTAISTLSRAVDLGTGDVECTIDLATALLAAGQGPEGIATLTEVTKRAPLKFRGHLELARGFMAAHRIDEALVSFAKACQIEPYRIEPLVERARMLARASRFEEALESFEAASRLNGKSHNILVEYAQALRQTKRFSDAERVLTTAAQSATNVEQRTELRTQAASMCFADGRLEQAILQLESVLESNPGHLHATQELARILLRAGEPQKATRVLEDSLQLQPKDPDLLRQSAEMSIHLGGADGATSAFARLALVQKSSHGPEFTAGKAAYKLEAFEMAATLFERAIAARPGRAAYHVELGRALSRLRRLEGALTAFETGVRLEPANHDAYHGVGAMLRALGRPQEAIAALRRAIDINPRRVNSLSELGQLYEGLGDLSAASECYEAAMTHAPDNANVFVSAARIDFETGHVERAVARCERALAINPENRNAALYLRWMKTAEQSTALEPVSVCVLRPLTYEQAITLAAELGDAAAEIVVSLQDGPGMPLPARIKNVAGDWRKVVTAATSPRVLTVPACDIARALLESINERLGPRIGGVIDGPGSAAAMPALWRRDLLQTGIEVFRSEDWSRVAASIEERAQMRRLHPGSANRPLERLDPAKGREAWLVSSSGVKLFGGVEQFLRTMVPIYRAAGMTPVIVGLLEREDGSPPSGETDGIPFLNTTRGIADIRRLALQRRPLIAHGTTGIGYELSAGLEGLETRIVYGSHFWRDMFHGSGSFENIDRNPRPRPEFSTLCMSVDQPYANSTYTRDVVRAHFGTAHPVVYSLPFDRGVDDPKPRPGASALLLNGRTDKGFGLALRLAKARPAIPFQVVAAQVARERIEEQIEAAGVRNIEILPWAADTESLYRQARVVLVPSYAFVETFSRVVIEAQRFGVPVFGSDRGNVPVLLAESGTVLPEEEDTWLTALDRIFGDDAYWHEQSARAIENSNRYRFDEQHHRVGRLINGALKRVAIGVGSGIGNMIQCSPAIRRVSEHFGCPVDVLLREDFPGCSALFEGSKWVGSVITADAARARYDAVLLLDAYGTLTPHFNADETHVSRRRFSFDQMREIHEAEFNLMAAKEFLGVPYEPADAGRYFIGAHHAPRGNRKRIAIHAGSKGGVWAAKHWPYFPELVERLQAAGYEPASFGTPGEYVPNTTNLTGTSLEETIRNMADCGYLIANDSGLMHVADALNLPLTTIFAPTSVIKNGPLAPNARVIKINKDCSPCQFDMRKLATCRCISEISIDEVWEKVRFDLKEFCSSAD